MPKVNKETLPIARRDNVKQGTMIYGFDDRRYSLPTFSKVFIRDGKVYGQQGAKEWGIGDADSRYQFDKQEYGVIIFKLIKSCKEN